MKNRILLFRNYFYINRISKLLTSFRFIKDSVRVSTLGMRLSRSNRTGTRTLVKRESVGMGISSSQVPTPFKGVSDHPRERTNFQHSERDLGLYYYFSSTDTFIRDKKQRHS